MKYREAKDKIFVTGVMPDGYSGDTQRVGFTLAEGGHCLTVSDHGYFKTGIPCAIDENEAYWLLKHHPTAKNIKELTPCNPK